MESLVSFCASDRLVCPGCGRPLPRFAHGVGWFTYQCQRSRDLPGGGAVPCRADLFVLGIGGTSVVSLLASTAERMELAQLLESMESRALEGEPCLTC